MAEPPPSDYGSLLTALLLPLGLGFAGYWIYSYAGGTGQHEARWFGVAAVVIVVAGSANYPFQAWRPPRGR